MIRPLAAGAALLIAVAGAPSVAAGQAAPAPDGLTIHLIAVPATTPAGATIFVAGSFNEWNPADSAFRLQRRGDAYVIALPVSVRGPVEFKFTLGSWESVEQTASGGDVPNRTFTVPPAGAASYEGTVAAWAHGPAAPRPHTARATVSIVSNSFAMPQLGRTRRVWLYMPPDYATSGRRYPVLYFHDGQNVFDAATSYAGEWGVDETLDSLHTAGDPGVIVVAVDNGGAHRIDEYTPWPMSVGQLTGGGEGSKYVDFLVQTLKPWVDAHYRTRPGRLDTGIGGSSLGGLISFYAALRYPEVFGGVLAFSTPFFLNPQLFALARSTRPQTPPTRFYFDSGLEEGSIGLGLPEHAFARSVAQMLDTLAAAGFDTARDVRSLLPADGRHAEWFWLREFAAGYRWLFAPAGARDR